MTYEVFLIPTLQSLLNMMGSKEVGVDFHDFF